MKYSKVLFLLMIAVSATNLGVAQESWDTIPHGVEVLRQSASSKTEFVLDHSMLILASKFDSDNEDLLRVIAGVSGVSVHRFGFREPWEYDPETLRSVKEEYHAAGWKQLMSRHLKDGSPGGTELWMHLKDDAISNVAILLTRSNEVTFIEVSGSISPLDLSHLGGHFGIPKLEGGVRVPNSSRR